MLAVCACEFQGLQNGGADFFGTGSRNKVRMLIVAVTMDMYYSCTALWHTYARICCCCSYSPAVRLHPRMNACSYYYYIAPRVSWWCVDPPHGVCAEWPWLHVVSRGNKLHRRLKNKNWWNVFWWIVLRNLTRIGNYFITQLLPCLWCESWGLESGRLANSGNKTKIKNTLLCFENRGKILWRFGEATAHSLWSLDSQPHINGCCWGKSCPINSTIVHMILSTHLYILRIWWPRS